MNSKLPVFRNFYSALAIAFFLAVGIASAAQGAVKAQLSRSQTAVGTPVQLLIEVDGSTNVVLPQSIDVEGLQIQRTGQQTRVEIINFRMKTSAVFSYTIYPGQEGEFEIPAIDVTVDGKQQRTSPLQLTVDAGSPGVPVQRALPVTPGVGVPPATQPAPQAGVGGEDERAAFAELIVPQQSAFVGEMVPVEVRFYFNQGYEFEIQGHRPNLSGEGFTVQRLPDPQRGEQRVGNANYHVFTFRTAITPLKSGEIEIPSVTLDSIMRAPMRSMGGSFDDIFDQFFGGSGFPGVGQARRVTIASDPMTLTVKPLPREGKPENFSGAVGDFTLSASADPLRVGPGEPVTLSVTVAGRGNFDSMGDPLLTGDAGWRSYPPTQGFTAQDAIGYGGSKRFDFMLVAIENRNTTPGAEFSYFNPGTEEYVTVTAAPVTVSAEAPSADPRMAAAASPGATPAEDPPAADDEDVSPATAVGTVVHRSFSPWILSVGAWVVHGVAALAVVALFIAAFIKRRNATATGVLARQRRARQALMKEVASSSDSDFAEAAVRVLEFDAAVCNETGAWARVATLENDSRTQEHAAILRDLLAEVDEARFSGATGVARKVTGDRAAVLKALKKVVP